MKVHIKYSPEVEQTLTKFQAILAHYEQHLIDNANLEGRLIFNSDWPKGFNPVIEMLWSQDKGRQSIVRAIDKIVNAAQPIDIILED